MVKRTTFRADFLLLTAALIWGLAFVAQRKGMEYVGPFTFNAIRFFLGGAALYIFSRIRKPVKPVSPGFISSKYLLIAGIISGIFLFMASSLQQVGIVTTTAGKAGFITGTYVVIVPILGVFLGRKTRQITWIGALITVLGLYLLSIKKGFHIEHGDLLVLISALFWAGHVLLIDRFSNLFSVIKLAVIQYLICSFISFAVALGWETITFNSIWDAAFPIAYAGFMSVTIAFTLQVLAQREAHPAHSAIILSLESVFALIGGWLILRETLLTRSIVGCSCMLTGMIISQIGLRRNKVK